MNYGGFSPPFLFIVFPIIFTQEHDFFILKVKRVKNN